MNARTTIGLDNPLGRTVRRTAVCASVAMLIATGGYAATTTFGADSYDQRAPSAWSDYVLPSPRVERELVETIQALYGPSRAQVRGMGMTRHTRRQARRAQQEVTIGLYGARN